MGSIFLRIQGLFFLSKAMCVLVNGIIRLIESVCLGPKVIPLSGAHCILINAFVNNSIRYKRSFVKFDYQSNKDLNHSTCHIILP
jgi:hypothetical protein